MRRMITALSLLSTTLALAQPSAPTKEQLAKGKELFAINCAPCHGAKGAGDGPAAVALNPKPRNFATESFKNGDKPEEVFKTLTAGLPGTAMVSFAHLSEKDRWALAHHVVELRSEGKPAVADAGTKPAPQPAKPKK